MLCRKKFVTLHRKRPDGGIGRRDGLKHRWGDPSRFEPGSGYKAKEQSFAFLVCGRASARAGARSECKKAARGGSASASPQDPRRGGEGGWEFIVWEMLKIARFCDFFWSERLFYVTLHQLSIIIN